MGFFGSLLGGLLDGGIGGGGRYTGTSIVRDPVPSKDLLRDVKENDDGMMGDFLRICDDAKDEFSELFTVGFYEMVIKGNSDYKTSSELCGEANRMIYEQAERFKRKCMELNQSIIKLNDHITALYTKKIELAKKLSVQVKGMEVLDKEFCYQSWTEPSYVESKSNLGIVLHCVGFGDMASIPDRINSAKAYVEEAKDYGVMVSNKIAQMNRISVFIEGIEQLLTEEEEILGALELSINMKRKLQYEKVASQLHQLIVEYVMEENCQRNETYVRAMDEMKRLCSHI